MPPSHRGGPPMARGGHGDLPSRSSGLHSSSGDPRDSGGELGFGSGAVQVYAPNTPAQADARLSDREQDALVSRFQALSASDPDHVVRPGFGKRGAAIAVRANFFALKYPKDVVLYDYPVVIAPDVVSLTVRKRVFELLESTLEVAPYLHEIAHDWTQRLVSRSRLPADFSATVSEGPERVYTVKVLEPKELRTADLDRYLRGEDADYNPLPIISAFNLVTTAHASHTGVPDKKGYLFPPSVLGESPLALSAGLEAWKGFFATVRPAYGNLMVNVNVCMGAFYVPNVRLSDAMIKYQQTSYGASNPQSFYRRVRVTTKHLGYRRKSGIKAFGSQSARKTVFQCDELGGMVSVEQYFQRKFNIRLQHADDLPVVNVGNKAKDTFVPAELCEIEPGQPYAGMLSEREILEMEKYTAVPPFVSAKTIAEQGLEVLGLRSGAPPIQGFGVKFSLDMAVVPARLLSPPKVIYSSDSLTVANGSWNTRNVRFHRPAQLTRAAILVLADGGREDFRDSSDSALRSVVTRFLATCRASGMQVDDALPPLLFVRLPQANPRDPLRTAAIDAIENEIKTLPGRPNIMLVFVSNSGIYPGLKKLCDSKLGIATVCMQMANVREERGQDRYLSSIALKINTKLGGVNHQLDASSMRWLKNTMLVGMDLTRPGVGCVKGTPSITAVVASCDEEFMHYPASLGFQEQGKEMITGVKQMMTERLSEYLKHMKTLPERVVVFRGGVSDGQFKHVLAHELPEIKAAFRSFKGYSPKLTIAICGKRHRTRFYPMRPEQADKTSNTKAGTLVDRGVTAVYNFDFFLQAHAGQQGTVRATHYTVIFDENRFSADDIQQGAHDASYLWAPTTKSVRLVPPAYAAERARQRARLYLHEILPPPPGSRESAMDEAQILRRAKELWGTGVHENLRGSMFYL
ncbi:Piwi-domain-containing protein [Phellopilus nigrolimitatus]|nr:Piwi-domain-containing protein [Phellopilus nigrolimitatus]